MKDKGDLFLASSNQMTIVDIILFNELSQVFYMYNYYLRHSNNLGYDSAKRKREENDIDTANYDGQTFAKLIMNGDDM